MGAFACGTLKDICLPRLVLPVCLPTCLQKPLGKWRPDANPAWIGTSLLPTTHGGSWALLPYTKAPGTLHYHAMFSDWETVPWAHCTETAPPTPKSPLFNQLPKLSCPGPPGQDHHDPSAS